MESGVPVIKQIRSVVPEKLRKKQKIDHLMGLGKLLKVPRGGSL